MCYQVDPLEEALTPTYLAHLIASTGHYETIPGSFFLRMIIEYPFHRCYLLDHEGV